MKKIIVILLLVIGSKLEVKSQILNLFKGIESVSKRKDTILPIRYFRNVEAQIQTKIDSFWLEIKSVNIKSISDSDFFIQSKISISSDSRTRIHFTVWNTYHDYKRFTRNNGRNSIVTYAVSFNRGIPILYTYTNKNSSFSVLNNKDSNFLIGNIIEQHVPEAVRDLIRDKPIVDLSSTGIGFSRVFIL